MFAAPRRCAVSAAGVLLVAAGLGVAVLGGGPARAASASGNTGASVAVPATITLSGLTSSFTLTGNPGTTATQGGAVAMNVQTNNRTGYTVSVQAAAAQLVGATSGNTDTIPIANLKVREIGQASYTSLSSTAAVTVHTQGSKSANAGDALSDDYQVTVPFVNSDTYSATLSYVASTQ